MTFVRPYAPDRASPLRRRFFSSENTSLLNQRLVSEARTRLGMTIALQNPMDLLPTMQRALAEYNEYQPVHPRNDSEMRRSLERMNTIAMHLLLDQLRLTAAQIKTNATYRMLRQRPGYGQRLIPSGDYRDDNPEVSPLPIGRPELFRRR